MEAISREYGVGFLDGAKHASPSDVDCIHMDEENHRRLGLAVEEKLRELLQKCCKSRCNFGKTWYTNIK